MIVVAGQAVMVARFVREILSLFFFAFGLRGLFCERRKIDIYREWWEDQIRFSIDISSVL